MALNTGNSTEANYNEVNNFMRDAKNDQQVRVIKDEAGTRRVILDKDGLRTSPAGVDVFTATNAQLSFNSNNNTLKVVASGTATVSKGASVVSGSTTVPNPTSYVPAVLAYYTVGSVYLPFPHMEFTTAGLCELSATYYVDNGSGLIGFNIETPNVAGSAYYAGAQTYTIRYYVLQETAN